MINITAHLFGTDYKLLFRRLDVCPNAWFTSIENHTIKIGDVRFIDGLLFFIADINPDHDHGHNKAKVYWVPVDELKRTEDFKKKMFNRIWEQNQ